VGQITTLRPEQRSNLMKDGVSIVRRTVYGVLAAGVSCAALATGSASAEPVADCNASGLSGTISSVTASLSDYFTAHPDVNQALIDFARQPGFVAVGQFDGYFSDHPQAANDLRAIQRPLVDYKDRCGMQVTPTEALTVLSDV
jgi:hemophore-related protein